MSVLVVDDSDLIRRMIVKTMRLADLATGSVYEAANGREALELMSESWVDVVLADLNMPVMDGLEMIKEMRSREALSDIPVVVVSTEGAESRISELEALGIAAYLRKPFTPEQIRDVVCQLPVAPRRERAQRNIEAIVCDVLQRFALMLAEPSDSIALQAPAEELLLARTGLRGAVLGIVSVAAPVSLASEMAVNALGSESDDEELMFRAADTLGEVANMVGGHVATTFDHHEHTSISPPIVTRMTYADWSVLDAAAGTIHLDVEGRPLLASLTLKSEL